MEPASTLRRRCFLFTKVLVLIVSPIALVVTYNSFPSFPTPLSPLAPSPFWDDDEGKALRASPPVTSSSEPAARCPDVLRHMLRGRWHQRHMTPEEVERMRKLYKQVREGDFHMPKGAQRADKRCGNVNLGSGTLSYFKGVCDPEGDTPCCYNNVCLNRSIQQCTCATCEDMRTPIHAEYATWRPLKPSCQPQKWSVDAICRLLKNSTIHFIGDSLMRHDFTAFLLEARGNFETGAFRAGTPDKLRSSCSGLYMFTEKVCRGWVDDSATLCNGSVTAKLFRLWSLQHVKRIHEAVLSLRNTPRSLALFGIGLHARLNVNVIRTHLLQPLLQTMKSKRLTHPRLLWAGVHQMGMLKAPYTDQSNKAVRAYNKAIGDFLHAHSVDVFDTYDLTHNVVSFDGTHYGYGVNGMKMSIFFHYLQELRSLGKW